MTTDEGTPKRRRGLFRRDRGNAAPTDDERRGVDTFDDPWSASAWDDWDDDFTNGGARSSVPAAAAPRPEAVDAWLQSEADDFDTAARRNTKRWGGDANRPSDPATTGLRSLRAETEPSAEPTATVLVPGSLGLDALRESDTSADNPLRFTVPDAADTHAEVAPTDLTNRVAADWASDPDLLAVDESAVHDEVTIAVDDAVDDDVSDAVDDNVSDAVDDALDEISALADGVSTGAVDEPVGPTWEPVQALAPDTADTFSHEAVEVHADLTAEANAEVTVEVNADVGADQSVVENVDAPMLGQQKIFDHLAETAHELPGGEESVAPLLAATTTDDDLVLADALESEQLEIDDLAALDEEPETLTPPHADWAPNPTRFVTVSVVGHDDQAEVLSPQPQPTEADSIVGVDVVSGDDLGESSLVTADDARMAPRPTPLRVDATAPTERTSDERTPSEQTSAAAGPREAPPKLTSRRWAALAAEFGSDGDLDDSSPRRPRPATPPTATPPTVDASITTTDAGSAGHSDETVAPIAVAVVDAVADADADVDVDETVAPIADAAADAAADASEVVETIDVSDATASANATAEPDIDPWAQPLVRDARPEPARSRPPSTRTRPDPPTSAEEDPWTRPPQRPERPPASVRAARPGSPEVAPNSPNERPATNPAMTRPTPDRPRPSPTLGPAMLLDDEVSEDISSFAGYIGTALVGFAIVRIVLTLLGDQPVIPARYSGREASLLRIGESFGSAGSAWPIALVVGTVLLTAPGFLAIRSHLRRWAPIVGLATVTAIVAVAIGALRFVAGRRIGSATTVKLISDVVVGPIGFGLLTLVAIALAIRSYRR